MLRHGSRYLLFFPWGGGREAEMNEDGLGGTDADLSQSTDAPAVFTGDNVLSSLVTRATSAWIPSETAPQCPFHVGENTSSVHI